MHGKGLHKGTHLSAERFADGDDGLGRKDVSFGGGTWVIIYFKIFFVYFTFPPYFKEASLCHFSKTQKLPVPFSSFLLFFQLFERGGSRLVSCLALLILYSLNTTRVYGRRNEGMKCKQWNGCLFGAYSVSYLHKTCASYSISLLSTRLVEGFSLRWPSRQVRART